MGGAATRRAGGRLVRGLALGLAVCLAPAVPATPAPAQTWYDALVARVNGQPILASDLTVEDTLYGPGRSYAAMDAATREEILTGLINRRLLLSEAERFGVAEPPAPKVDEATARLRERLGDRLAGIDDATLRSRVRARMWADAFVDARIRVFVVIREAQVEPKEGAGPAPADEAAREDPAKKVAEQRLESYLKRLKGRATIRRYLEPPGALNR